MKKTILSMKRMAALGLVMVFGYAQNRGFSH